MHPTEISLQEHSHVSACTPGILAFEAAREINSVGTVRVSHLIISAVNNPCLLTEVNRDPSSTRWFNASDEVLSGKVSKTPEKDG